jgi:hypothetical protein
VKANSPNGFKASTSYERFMRLKTFFWATLASAVLASGLFLFVASALMLFQNWHR